MNAREFINQHKATLGVGQHLKSVNRWSATIEDEPDDLVFSKNNHFKWMYNNQPFEFRTSWSDIFAVEFGKCENNDARITSSIGREAEIKKALREISAHGVLGFIYAPNNIYQDMLTKFCNEGNIPFQEYYLHLEGFPAIQVPNGVRTINISRKEFETFLITFGSVTLCTNINLAYRAMLLQHHNGICIFRTTPPLLENSNSNGVELFGPPAWQFLVFEDVYAIGKWCIHVGKSGIINFNDWSPDLLRSWFMLDDIRNVVRDYIANKDLFTNTNRFMIPIARRAANTATETHSSSLFAHSYTREMHAALDNLNRKTVSDLRGAMRRETILRYPLRRIVQHFDLHKLYNFNYTSNEYGEVYE